MDLNFAPVMTTRNYGINFAKVDDSVFCGQISKFKNVKIDNECGFLLKKVKKMAFLQKIGAQFDEQLEKEPNIILNFDINKDTDKTLVLSFNFDKENKTLVEQLNFVVEENVTAKVILNFRGNELAYHNGLVRFDCKKNSSVDVAIISNLYGESVSVLRVQNSLEENAKINFNIVDFGGKVSIQNYYTKLAGQNSVSNLNSLYVAGGDSFVDLNYEQDVFGKQCKAVIQTVGALYGQARKHFKGTINFEKGCKKSVGSEDELCLLLSKQAKSKALPMLLCTEEDVDGKHSSSVGKVGEKELFYIMSRGFSEQEAVKLVVKAKFAVLLEKIFDEELKQKLFEIVDGKLSYEE